MRICYAFPFYNTIGGVETSLREIGRRMAQRHSVWILAGRAPDGSTAFDDVVGDGISVIPVPSPRFNLPRTRCGSMNLVLDILSEETFSLAIARRLRSISPDIFHIMQGPGVLAAPLSRLNRHRLIVTVHWTPSDGYRFLLRRFAGGVVAVNDGIKEVMLTSSADSPLMTIIPNGVDIDAFGQAADTSIESSTSAEPPVLLTVARIHPHKGLDSLISAMRIVTEEVPEASLRLVGPLSAESVYERELRQNVIDLGLERVVEFVGYVPHVELPSLYRKCSLFVLPSRSESQPITLLEAMAAGKPIVASDLPGVRDIVQDGVNGVLFPAGDSERLAESIIRLLKDPALARSLGQRGPTMAGDFSWEGIVTRLEEFYDRVLDSRGSSSP